MFNEFFVKLDAKPRRWEDQLNLFIAHLIQNKRKSTTIRCYISVIKSVLKDNNIKICEDKYLLSSLIRACKLKNDRVHTRLPIGKNMLCILLKGVWDKFLMNNQVYLEHLYMTLLTTMSYGMFRIGELTMGTHPVRVDDVHIGQNKPKMLFVLHTSKTHTRGVKPQKIMIEKVAQNHNRGLTKQTTRWCPFTQLTKFIKLRRTSHSPTEPFFIFRDRSPVKPFQLHEVLHKSLINCGFNNSLYSVHSLRSGRAIQLFKQGVSVETIKHLVVGNPMRFSLISNKQIHS